MFFNISRKLGSGIILLLCVTFQSNAYANSSRGSIPSPFSSSVRNIQCDRDEKYFSSPYLAAGLLGLSLGNIAEIAWALNSKDKRAKEYVHGLAMALPRVGYNTGKSVGNIVRGAAGSVGTSISVLGPLFPLGVAGSVPVVAVNMKKIAKEAHHISRDIRNERKGPLSLTEGKKKKFQHLDQPECPICLEHFAPHEKVVALRCHHIYHTGCYHSHAEYSRSKNEEVVCPICRKSAHNEVVEFQHQDLNSHAEAETSTPPRWKIWKSQNKDIAKVVPGG